MKVAAVAAMLFLSGCAVAPESIAPSYVSEIPYDSYSCQQLGEEFSRVSNALGTASQQQNNARSQDTVGVLLLGLPVSSLSGGNVAPQVAQLKGEENAIQQASIRKNCHS